MSSVTVARAAKRMGPRRAAAAPLIALPALSLLASAAMLASAFGVAPIPGGVWAAALVVTAAVVAATGRGRGTAHLALEPFAMALMFVLAAVHGHAVPASVTDASAASTAPAASTAHAAHLGGPWLVVALAVAVAVLSAACLACALRVAVTHRPRAAVLPVASAAAMCAMAVWMLAA
ncbi:hypothetical protein ASE16_05380 [Leifsonia sp. Root227]|uniref:hypothetical protein n=1 Tax=Leifsonia sp. Root227 TaxID=1736496 RepID=UPI0006FD7234|nr:hypothetical protein [Leifsonia sp. Root227]KRC50457.1 hypothetical protein ASE16_05380 [Leifsonia sp. Root227]